MQIIYRKKTASEIKFNFQSGFSATCLDHISQCNDMHKARERIRKRQEDGMTIAEQLSKCAKLPAGNIVKAGTNRLGKTILDLIIERLNMKERELQKKIETERQEWTKTLHKALEFLKTEKPKDELTVKEHEIVLQSLRRNKTEKIPTRKQDLIALFDDWKDRTQILVPEWGDNCACDDDAEKSIRRWMMNLMLTD